MRYIYRFFKLADLQNNKGPRPLALSDLLWGSRLALMLIRGIHGIRRWQRCGLRAVFPEDPHPRIRVFVAHAFREFR